MFHILRNKFNLIWLLVYKVLKQFQLCYFFIRSFYLPFIHFILLKNYHVQWKYIFTLYTQTIKNHILDKPCYQQSTLDVNFPQRAFFLGILVNYYYFQIGPNCGLITLFKPTAGKYRLGPDRMQISK